MVTITVQTMHINILTSKTIKKLSLTKLTQSTSKENEKIYSKIYYYETNTKKIRTFKGHSSTVTSVAITPDGKYIVSGSRDNTIKLWDIKSGEEICQFVSFNDGEWIASTKDGYYNCSKNAYKYFNFQNNKEVITDKNHPIYKKRKKKKLLNINIKPIDLSNAPQTQIDYSTMHSQDDIPDIELDEDEIPY